jgi:hypothetical protein
VTIETQLIKLHHHMSALDTEWAITVDLTDDHARARDIANHDGA